MSTNMIDKITGLNGMRNLKILSIGRNYIKTISGLVSKKRRNFETESSLVSLGMRCRHSRGAVDELQFH